MNFTVCIPCFVPKDPFEKAHEKIKRSGFSYAECWRIEDERLKEAKHLLPLPPRCSQLSPSPITSFYITRETRLLAGDAPVLPKSLLSSLFDFIETKRWILTRTRLLTTRGLPSPK